MMLDQLTKTTRRKFYNKWLYKVTLRLSGAALLRIYNRQQVDDLLRTLDDSEEKWTKRIENETVDIYTNSKSLYEEISDKFEILLVHRFEPDPDNIDILEKRDGKTMTVKKLPHNRYQYRVYILPHNLKDHESKQKFIDWLEVTKPRVTCTSSIKKWILTNHANWDRRYILVEDEGTLMLMKLRNPDVIGTVYKFEVIE
jgi:hypothetical protein